MISNARSLLMHLRLIHFCYYCKYFSSKFQTWVQLSSYRTITTSNFMATKQTNDRRRRRYCIFFQLSTLFCTCVHCPTTHERGRERQQAERERKRKMKLPKKHHSMSVASNRSCRIVCESEWEKKVWEEEREREKIREREKETNECPYINGCLLVILRSPLSLSFAYEHFFSSLLLVVRRRSNSKQTKCVKSCTVRRRDHQELSTNLSINLFLLILVQAGQCGNQIGAKVSL